MSASRLVIEGCVAVAGEEHGSGYAAIGGGRISASSGGRAPEEYREGARRIDGGGCLATPGPVDDLVHPSVSDPLAAFDSGPEPGVDLLPVVRRVVVENAEPKTGDEAEITREIAGVSRRPAERAEEVAL